MNNLSLNFHNHFKAPEQKTANDFFDFSFWVPGLPHILNDQQIEKGFVLLISAFSIIISLLFLIFSNIVCPKACQISLANILNISPLALKSLFEASIGFKIACASLLIILFSYLLNYSNQDFEKRFKLFELDKKPNVLAPSISTAYIIFLSIFSCFFTYGIFHFVPLKKEIPIDLIYYDNPIVKKEEKQPPKTKNLGPQNVKDSGQKIKNEKLQPGKYRKNRPVNNIKEEKVKTPQKQSKSIKIEPPKPKSQTKPSETRDNTLKKFKPKLSEEGENSADKSSNSNPTPKQISQQSSNSNSSNNIRTPVLSNKSSSASSSDQSAGSGNVPSNNPNGDGTIATRKSPVDYGPYKRDIQARIQRAWKPSSDSKDDFVKVEFQLYKNGQIVANSLKIIQATNKEASNVALKAIMDAAPSFRPLPEGSADKIIVRFEFTKTGISSSSGKSY